MSQQKYDFLVTLATVDVIALAGLVVTGGFMLWLIYKQPARWRAVSDKFDRFLVGTGLFPLSVICGLHRYDKFDRYFVWTGLIGCVVGGCLFIARFWPFVR